MDNTAPAIFCNLSRTDLRQRKADVRETLSVHIVASSFSQGISELAFSKPAVSRVQLEHLIKLEQACCPFFRFEVREMDNEFTLIVFGPKGSEEFVRDLFSSKASASCVCSG